MAITNHVVVIGSGLGGLLSGFLLSKEGMQVTVLEKHRKFGGCLQTFKRDRFTFDTGMHYIGSLAPGQTLNNYWKYFGLTDRMDLLKMDENGFDRISYIGTEYPLAQGSDNFMEQLLPYFPDKQTALKKYTDKLQEIANSHPLYNLELPSGDFIDKHRYITAFTFLSNLETTSPWNSVPSLCHSVKQIEPQRRTKDAQRNTKEKYSLAQVLAGNNFLYAGSPTTTPLSQFGLINHSFISSSWRLAGGSQQIADILVEGIRANGGRMLARKKANRITKSGSEFTIYTADGDHFHAGQVVSDIHPAATLNLLDGIRVQKAFQERICGLENTASVFSVYLGLKPDVFPYLNHNVYHYTSENVWNTSTSSGNRWPESFLFITPPEKDQGKYANTAVIMTTMLFDELTKWDASDSGARDKTYSIFKAKKAKQLLDVVYAKFPDLKEAVVTIDISTPLTWRDYTGTPQGSMYGIVKDASNPQKTTIFPKTKVPGLFFTGQSVNMHGALGVTIGAVMTCGEILGLPYILKTIKQNV